MPKVIIIYDTVYGNTGIAAEAMADGVKEAGLQVEVRHVKDVKPEDVTAADPIMMGSPTHAGALRSTKYGILRDSRRLEDM